MRNSAERILTSHVGSLCRPANITEVLRAQSADEPWDDAEFSAMLTPAVAEVVRQQSEAGVDIPSDGEFGKSMWTGYVSERLSGIAPHDGPMMGGVVPKDWQEFAEFYAVYHGEPSAIWIPQEVRERHPGLTWIGVGVPHAASGPVTYIGQDAVQRDISNLKAAMKAAGIEEAFLPVAAPASVEATIPNAYYPDDESYLEALAAALNVEYKAIVDAGLVVQLDDAFIPFNYERFLAQGKSMEEYLAHSALRVDAVNEALRGIPEDRVRYHICWGSWPGPHASDVPMKDIVHLMLRVNAQAYSFEAANPRHEFEWKVWEDVELPEGKILMPGVVTHSTNVVEHPETVAQRIERFANLVGPENVIAGTDCGFSQGWSMPRTHPTVQWAKLRSLAEGARIASSRLLSTSA